MPCAPSAALCSTMQHGGRPHHEQHKEQADVLVCRAQGLRLPVHRVLGPEHDFTPQLHGCHLRRQHCRACQDLLRGRHACTGLMDVWHPSTAPRMPSKAAALQSMSGLAPGKVEYVRSCPPGGGRTPSTARFRAWTQEDFLHHQPLHCATAAHTQCGGTLHSWRHAVCREEDLAEAAQRTTG